MKITYYNLRKLIIEEIGRSFKTNNNDPFSYMDYEDIDVEIYPTDMGDTYHVKIETIDGSISLPVRSFKTEPEAVHYARNKTEEIRRIIGSKQR